MAGLRIANEFRNLEYEIGEHYDGSFDLRHGVIPTALSSDEAMEILRYRWRSDELANEARGLLKDQPIGVRVQEISKAASVLGGYSDPWPPVDKWQGFDDFPEALSTKNESDLLAFTADIPLEEWRELAAGSEPESEPWFEAKFHIISLLLETNPLRAREEMDQRNPDSIPQPWAARFLALDQRIDG